MDSSRPDYAPMSSGACVILRCVLNCVPVCVCVCVQVSSLEDYHKSQLRELQDLCQVVGHQSAHIQGLREEGERLARQLGAIGTLT